MNCELGRKELLRLGWNSCFYRNNICYIKNIWKREKNFIERISLFMYMSYLKSLTYIKIIIIIKQYIK